jgi:hypothetical protein
MMKALPEPITAYWNAANAGKTGEAAGWFADDATVHDEGRIHQGLPDVRAWIGETAANYKPVVEPLRWEEKEGQVHVAARVSGAFPGSPIELDFLFTLRDGRIKRLEIL